MQAPKRARIAAQFVRGRMYDMPAPCLLLSGFEPFGGETLNASWEIVRRLDGEILDGVVVRGVQLPCVFGASRSALDQAVRLWRPRWVLALGQAAGRSELSFERVAINVDDARIADNAGAQPIDEPVIRGGPAAHFTRLPIKAMAAAAAAQGVPAGISQTAGTFVCNHVFYGLLHSLRRRQVRGGFLHVPILPAQSSFFPGLPVLEIERQLAGTRAALRALIAHDGGSDLGTSGGAIA